MATYNDSKEDETRRNKVGKRLRQTIIKRTTSLSDVKFDVGEDEEEDLHLQPANSPCPRNRRASADYLETPHFLRSCGRCRRRLVPCRDIYMYRGDSAFCSLECRQQQMSEDERVEKCRLATTNEVLPPPPSASGQGETVAAV